MAIMELLWIAAAKGSPRANCLIHYGLLIYYMQYSRTVSQLTHIIKNSTMPHGSYTIIVLYNVYRTDLQNCFVVFQAVKRHFFFVGEFASITGKKKMSGV